MIKFDPKYYLFLNELKNKGEKTVMKDYISNLKDDDKKSELVEFINEEDMNAYNRQKQVYEKTLAFLKQFDREVALSFLATNMQLRGELGIFYEKLLEELE